jgi:hypothetical protein
VSDDANEQLFESYLTHYGYSFVFEPELPTVKKPDFAIWRDPSQQTICEVEGFSAVAHPPQPRRMGQVYTRNPHDEFGPLRRHITMGAQQLRDLRDTGKPLVVILANATSAEVDLGAEELMMAIDGDPRYVLAIDKRSGTAVSERYDGRDGKARDHLYRSAVGVVYKRLAEGGHGLEDPASLLLKENAQTTAPRVDVIKFVDCPAVALPGDLFDGPHDRIWEYSRKTRKCRLVRGS